MKLNLNKNMTKGIKSRRRGLIENENNPNMRKKPKDVRALRQDVYDVLDDHEVFEDNAEEVDKTVKAQAKKAGMKPMDEKFRYVRDLGEDYEMSDYSPKQMTKDTENLTKNFTKKSGTITTSYVNEKDHCRDLLKKHYKNVDVSDGRRSKDEDMSWVIAYSDPKSDLNESVSTDETLADKLYDDLEQTFEDNIIPKYASWVEDDSPYDLDGQQKLWYTFAKARSAYIQTLADVIRYVDVNGIDWH